MRRLRFLGVGLVVSWMGLGPAVGFSAERLTYSTPWVPLSRDAPLYVALDQGLYREANLDIVITRGYGGADVVTKVAAKAVEFGGGDIPSVIMARARTKAPVKVIGAYHDKSMYVIFSRKEKPIRAPKDLEGKIIGTAAGDSGRAIFPAFAAVNGIDPNKVRWQTLEAAITIPSLLSGAIDGTSLFYVSGPALWKSAKRERKETVTLFYSDHGVDTYSIGLVTTDEYTAKKQDLIRRFLRATYRGAAWTIENPQGATDTYRKYHPATDPEIARQMVDITIDHMLTKTAQEKGLGYVDEKKMTYTRDLITKYMNLPRTVPLAEIYTNEFLTRIFAKKGK